MQRDSGFFGSRPGIIYITETVCLSEFATSDVAGSLWAGIRDAGKNHDCDVLAFAGDYRPTGWVSVAHKLVTAQSADGFLAWHSRPAGSSAAFFERFADSPLIYLTTAHTEKPVEGIDDMTGVRALVKHLVQQHGCRRIAFMQGAEGHFSAQKRLAAYQEGLREQGIEPDPALITPPAPWAGTSGAKGVAVLLDERGLQPGVDIDAIMCVSDQFAMNALAELKRRNIAVPGQIKLTGVNNVREARASAPSLTTVSMPFALQSRRALHRLLHQIGVVGQEISGSEARSHVVVGESCGCGNQNLHKLYIGDDVALIPARNTPDPAALKEKLVLQLCQTSHQHDAQEEADRIIATLQATLQSGEVEAMLRRIKPHIRTGYFGLVDQAFWQYHWGQWHSLIPAMYPEKNSRAQALTAMEEIRMASAEIYMREQGQLSLWETAVASIMRDIGAEWSLIPDMPSLLAQLEIKLPLLEMDSCWLVLYDQVIVADVGGVSPTEARLWFAMENGIRKPLPADGLVFPAHQIIPPGCRHGEKPGVFVAFPVMQRECEYGYVIFNQSRSTDWGEAFSGLIGSAIRNLRLREDLLSAQKRLVEADKMAALGELVAGVAHEINTPVGIGVTAASTLLDESNRLVDAINRRDARNLSGTAGQIQECAEIALRNLERAAQLIESFKLIAVDQTRSEVRTIPLASYLQDVIRSLVPKLRPGKHTVEVDCPDDIEVTCDPSIVIRIITNLVMNSLLHGFEDGRKGHIHMHCWKNRNDWGIEYRDDGRGMDAATLEKMFHPFFTTRRGRGGTGLGMHIVYNLVTQGLKGHILCESKPEAGICFRITAPL